MKLIQIHLFNVKIFIFGWLFFIQPGRSARNNWHACKLALEGNIIQYWRKMYPSMHNKISVQYFQQLYLVNIKQHFVTMILRRVKMLILMFECRSQREINITVQRWCLSNMWNVEILSCIQAISLPTPEDSLCHIVHQCSCKKITSS